MSTSPIERTKPSAQSVEISDGKLNVTLVDGRMLSVPIDWYPRLAHGTPTEWRNWRLIGRGEGIHWPELDEDISVEHLLAGYRSTETQRSIDNWLRKRRET